MQPKPSIPFEASNPPDLTVLRMDELIGPEPGLNTIEAPGPITSDAVTVIEGQQNLSRPPDRIRSLLPFKASQGNGMARN